MFHIRVVAAITFALTLVISAQPGAQTPSQVPSPSSAIGPGCDLPRSYGHMVGLVTPSGGGLAGQAMFEDPATGTIRFVAFIYAMDFPRFPSATRLQEPVFPLLPNYECKLGAVWTRH